jgi:toxin HigB-1
LSELFIDNSPSWAYIHIIHPRGDFSAVTRHLFYGEEWLRFRFGSKKLRGIYEHETGAERIPAEVVDAFFEVMSVVSAALDERDFRALKSLHFEKLEGDRKGQQSFRLNKQWRLIVSIQKDEKGKYLSITEIDNHYKK